MTSEEYIDHVYNLGYNDATHGKVYRDSLTLAMSSCGMSGYYDRGWSDGGQDK